MLHPTQAELIEKLKKLLENGTLTRVDSVGPGTFVCLTQATPLGMAYHQGIFDALPREIGMAIEGRKVGFKIGDLKVIAIFDIWPEMDTVEAPPVKVLDN